MIAAFLAALALICATTLAVRWVDRCDCRWSNETGDES